MDGKVEMGNKGYFSYEEEILKYMIIIVSCIKGATNTPDKSYHAWIW